MIETAPQTSTDTIRIMYMPEVRLAVEFIIPKRTRERYISR